MSGAEIQFRVREKARIEIEKARLHFARNGMAKSLFIPKEARLASMLDEKIEFSDIDFFGLGKNRAELKAIYKRSFPAEFSKALNNAESILEHKFHFLGHDFSLQGHIDWNRNPATGKTYPGQHYSTISIGDTQRYGDIKYLWELNRHQFFIELGKAYFTTGDEKYAIKIKEFIDGWITSNPFKLTVNWTSALESALRIFSWIWTFHFTSESKIWTSELREKFLSSLILEAAFVEEKLSYYFSPYNHLIGELAALTFLGTVFPFSSELTAWRDKYWSELESQVESQFHEDGFSVEQASYYHHFTLGFFLMTAILRKQNRLPVSSHVWQRLENALQFSLYLTRPNGQTPMIGDIDSARSIYFNQPDDMWNLRPFLGLGAVLFNRADMKYVAGSLFEEILWMFGKDGLETYQQMSPIEPERLSGAFEKSGYFIMRDGWKKDSNFCYFDCGEIAHGVHADDTPSAAHGHADILSFELSVEGEPVVVDPGFHTYFGPQDWHRYFRSSMGHNVVELNGKGQATPGYAITWSKVSCPKPIHWFSSPEIDLACGKIDRFSGLKDRVFMRRCILFNKPNYFLLVDQIVGEEVEDKMFDIDSYLHFLPGDIRIEASTVLRDQKKLAVLALSSEASVRIESGGERPNQGWIAQGYGQRLAAPVMTISVKQVLPAQYGILFPIQNGGDAPVNFSMSENSIPVLRFDIQMGDWKEIIIINPLGESFSPEISTSIQTDAMISKIREEKNEISELFLAKVSNLEINGKPVSVADPAGTTVYLKDQN
jgi:hypothetical protein